MLVPVLPVGGVAMAVVDVVLMSTVPGRLVTASRTVDVGVILVDDVDLPVALVPVGLVAVVEVNVVQVVGVAAVLDGDVPAATSSWTQRGPLASSSTMASRWGAPSAPRRSVAPVRDRASGADGGPAESWRVTIT